MADLIWLINLINELKTMMQDEDQRPCSDSHQQVEQSDRQHLEPPGSRRSTAEMRRLHFKCHFLCIASFYNTYSV